jgi:hypothetical protein
MYIYCPNDQETKSRIDSYLGDYQEITIFNEKYNGEKEKSK